MYQITGDLCGGMLAIRLSCDDLREAFSRDLVVANNASDQCLEEIEPFFSRVRHVDYADRVVFQFEVRVLFVLSLGGSFHRVDEGKEFR